MSKFQMLSKSFMKRYNFTFSGNKSVSKKEDSIMENSKEESINMAYASFESTSIPKPTDSTPLIILHGLFGSKNNWNGFSKVYHNKSKPTKRKVFAVDCRNHADSQFTASHNYDDLVLDLRKFMKNMNLKKVNLLGHCMGGRACMLFSLKYPEMVEKLIVADISPITTSINFKSIALLLSILNSIKLPSNIPLSQAKNEINRQLLPLVTNKSLRNFLMNNLVQKGDGNYKWSLNLPTLLKNYESIASFPDMHNATFDGPVLFLGGANSDFIQKSDLEKIQKLFPKAELRYIDGTGHWLQNEKPKEFLRQTLEFLNKKVKNYPNRAP